MTATGNQLEWVGYFDGWRRFEEHGHLFLEPPSGVVTAGDFAAIMRTGVTYASAVMRHTPKLGIYLAFAPSGTWREYQRIHPTLCNGLPGSGATDVVDLDNFDGDERDRTPTPRVGVQTMERVIRGGSS